MSRRGGSAVAAATVAAAIALLAPMPAAAAPETTITSGPEGGSRDPNPTFGFAADVSGSRFECRIDGGSWTLSAPADAGAPHVLDPSWAACSSPETYEHVDDGSHLFEVRAIGPRGEVDATPAARRFEIDSGVLGDATARPIQRLGPGRVRFGVRLTAEETVRFRIRGAITVSGGGRRDRYRLGLRSILLGPGAERRLRLEPARRDRRPILAAMRSRRLVQARVRVRLTNELGGVSRSWPAAVLLRRGR